MYKKIICLVVLLTCVLSSKSQTLLWESDLSSEIPSNSISFNGFILEIGEFPTGESVIISQPSYTNIHMVVLDDSGAFLAQGLLDVPRAMTGGYYEGFSVLENLSVGSFILEIDNYQETHLYLKCSVSNSVVNSELIGSEAQTSGAAPYSGGLFGFNPKNVFDDPITYYDYSHTDFVLRKYTFGSASAELAGGVIGGQDGSNYLLSWDSDIGEQYQIQSSPDLESWVDVGSPIVGNGLRLQWANTIETNKYFYRVEVK